MKKIYSFVLMAAMLLVGTNMKAATWPVDDFAGLQEAFEDAESGDLIQLTGDIDFGAVGNVIWLGTQKISETPKSLTLDLAGHDITKAGAAGHTSFFVLTHGELLVINSNSDVTSNIAFTGTSDYNSTIFTVAGSYKPTTDASNKLVNGYFSHLEIGENILLSLPNGCLGSAIAVDVVHNKQSGNVSYTASGNTIKYTTAILDEDYGFAYGVQVDVKGNISSMGVANVENPTSTLPSKKAYGIKTNGNLWSSREHKSPIAATAINEAFTDMETSYVNGYVEAEHTADVAYAPFVHVYPTCHITTTNGSTRSAAIYASGYAKWLIEGYCTGSIGVSISSGDVDINHATITSNGQQYNATVGTSGVSGSGSAIVVNSRNGYAGDIEVTLSGDATVTSEKGYAIEETVHKTGNESEVKELTLQGATVTGGEKGAIIIAEQTVDQTTIIAVDANGSITKKESETATPEAVDATDYGKMINGTTTDPTDTEHFNEDADYNVTVGTDTQTSKPTIVVYPNTSKVVAMNASGYATFSAVNKSREIKSADTDLKAYKFEAFDEVNGILTITPLGSLIPQNTGVIFKGEPGKSYILDKHDASESPIVSILKPAAEWSNNAPNEDGIIVGAVHDNVYVLSGDLLYKYEGANMKVNKAYLDLGTAPAPARIKMVIAETQDIENVEFEAVKAVKFIENGQVLIKRGEKVYNVQGQIVK